MLGFDPKEAKKHSIQRNAGKDVAQKKTAPAVPDKVAAMNQAPDTVPIMAKPGEYVLPVDTVHALGGAQQLDSVVDATHTPAPEAAVVPEGQQPQFFFSNGGQVPEEERRRLVQVPASMQRRENTTFEQPAAPAAPRPARDPGIASAAMGLPQDNAPTFTSLAAQGKSTPPVPVAAPLSAPTQPTPSEMGVAVPPSPNNIFPGNRLHGTSGFSGAPIRNSDLAPAAPPAPPVARNPAVTSVAMGLPQDSGPEMFSTPQMRASLSVPKPPAPPAPQPDPMAGMAATGFNPNITARAERPPAGVPSAPPKSNAGAYMGNPNSATAEFVNEASADAGRRWDQGDVAGAVGAGLRTGLGAVGIGAIEALDNTVGAAARGIWDGGGRLIGGLIGGQAQATPATAPAAPPTGKPATTSAPAAANTPAIAGLLDSGNIDLTKRPVVKNADGSISTVRSTSVNFDGKEYLIPTVSDDGRIMSVEEAVQQFKASGKHLGVFSNPQDATAYAKELSANQARMYGAAAAPAAPAATGSTAGQSGEQLPTGVYQHGRGQYSDSAQGMGFSPGFTGRPNAQNLNAASNLSAQSQRESMGRVASAMAQPQAGGFRAPTVNTSANDFTTREALRRAKMDATSLIHSSSWAPKGSGKAAQERYSQMQQADLAAQAQQGTMDMQAMGFNAGMAREQLQQDGALQRALIGQSTDAARLGLEERRLSGEETTRGFQTRQAQRIEQAQQAYLSAKTPAEKAAALKQMNALNGKSEDVDLRKRFMESGGGQEWDENARVMRNLPKHIIDLQTGKPVGGGGSTPANTPQTFEVGKMYEDGQGGKAIYQKDGTWKKM